MSTDILVIRGVLTKWSAFTGLSKKASLVHYLVYASPGDARFFSCFCADVELTWSMGIGTRE